jgi:hypothetical protein
VLIMTKARQHPIQLDRSLSADGEVRGVAGATRDGVVRAVTTEEADGEPLRIMDGEEAEKIRSARRIAGGKATRT